MHSSGEGELDRRYDWVGPPDKLSKIRPIRLRRLLHESPTERSYRLAREALNEWNCHFWSRHNQLFEKRKAEFYGARKKQIGLMEPVSAEDLSVFYKQFLNEQAPVFSAYNSEWYRRNFSLIWPAIKVNLIRLRRLLR